MAFAATEEVPYDSSGRIVLPPMMRRKGQIGDLALFLGTGETFQIWNPRAAPQGCRASPRTSRTSPASASKSEALS